MCIIIDANVRHQFVPPSEDARPVLDWIVQGAGRLVIGGKNTEELSQNGSTARWLGTLLRAGRARQVRREDIEAEEKNLRDLALCVSNDLHVIALARVSGARIVYTNDEKLHIDFRNHAVINQPRGHVYQVAGHRHLLRPGACRA
jgi:hypothetical protein